MSKTFLFFEKSEVLNDFKNSTSKSKNWDFCSEKGSGERKLIMFIIKGRPLNGGRNV